MSYRGLRAIAAEDFSVSAAVGGVRGMVESVLPSLVFVVAFVATSDLALALIVAIAGAESNFGQTLCGSFNAWGWSCPNSPGQFASWSEGIERIAEGLRVGYFDEGRLAVATIQQKWAPSGAANDPTGLNNNWTTNVSRFLLEQGGDPGNVSMGAAGGLALGGIAGLGGLGPAGDA